MRSQYIAAAPVIATFVTADNYAVLGALQQLLRSDGCNITDVCMVAGVIYALLSAVSRGACDTGAAGLESALAGIIITLGK